MLDEEISKAQRAVAGWIAQPTPLFRGLYRAPDPTRPLGKHWTDYRYTATDRARYILTADVTVEMIDWPGTIIRRISWPKEREFTLLSGHHLDCKLEDLLYHSEKRYSTFSGVT